MVTLLLLLVECELNNVECMYITSWLRSVEEITEMTHADTHMCTHTHCSSAVLWSLKFKFPSNNISHLAWEL